MRPYTELFLSVLRSQVFRSSLQFISLCLDSMKFQSPFLSTWLDHRVQQVWRTSSTWSTWTTLSTSSTSTSITFKSYPFQPTEMTGGVCLSEVGGFGVTARVKSRVMWRRPQRPQPHWVEGTWLDRSEPCEESSCDAAKSEALKTCSVRHRKSQEAPPCPSSRTPHETQRLQQRPKPGGFLFDHDLGVWRKRTKIENCATFRRERIVNWRIWRFWTDVNRCEPSLGSFLGFKQELRPRHHHPGRHVISHDANPARCHGVKLCQGTAS